MTRPTDDEIMKLAGEWFHTGENQKRDDGYYYRSLGTPSNVRGSDLIEFARALLAEQARPEQETDRDWSEAQDWKGMDGAIAWHLIDRHADGWDDVGAMMNAWLAAQAEPQPTIPEGWGFCSADFSLQASGVSEFGGVMLIRTGADRADWHFLTDEQREVIPLYVSGTGKTVAKAIASAAKNCTPLPATPPKD